ncbi:hypothetical protein RB195_025760 [Necator americanus]|uniref:Uncharacterized protein n=1 Tax=Necator americanus TaxID=51031 RepID=A0ABR1ETS6_NECAM
MVAIFSGGARFTDVVFHCVSIVFYIIVNNDEDFINLKHRCSSRFLSGHLSPWRVIVRRNATDLGNQLRQRALTTRRLWCEGAMRALYIHFSRPL